VSAKTSQQAAISKTAVDRAQLANEEKKDNPAKLKNYRKSLVNFAGLYFTIRRSVNKILLGLVVFL
jgi:hypothetical protein